MNDRVIQILLVEDDDVDAEAFRRALDDHENPNPVIRAENGLEALEILRGTESRPPLSQPYIVLLDLNMPKMSGIEFLEELRCDESLHDSVVFVLTTSSDDRDKCAAYQHNVAGYLVKSDVAEEFAGLIVSMTSFLDIVELPPSRTDRNGMLCAAVGTE